MNVIPVMDLLNGKVVQGIGGRRNEYQPISNSVVTSSAELYEVARAFQEKIGLNWFYIADLDRIQSTKNKNINREKLVNLAKSQQYNISLDAGCKTTEDVREIAEWNVNQIVMGTETLDSLEILSEAVNHFGPDKIMLSIDIKSGKLLANNSNIRKLHPVEIAKYAEELCLKGIIVIELHKVGSQAGPLNQSLLEITKKVIEVPIFAGGGVRNIDDLNELHEYGVSGALVATAFHKGKIGKDDLNKLLTTSD